MSMLAGLYIKSGSKRNVGEVVLALQYNKWFHSLIHKGIVNRIYTREMTPLEIEDEKDNKRYHAIYYDNIESFVIDERSVGVPEDDIQAEVAVLRRCRIKENKTGQLKIQLPEEQI